MKRSAKDGFLLVSHDRVFLDGCIDHVMAIEPSGMYCERGNFSSWWENRNRRLQQERSRNVQLKKEIAQLQRAKQASTGWSFQVEASKYNHGKKGAKLDRGYIGASAQRCRGPTAAGRARSFSCCWAIRRSVREPL